MTVETQRCADLAIGDPLGGTAAHSVRWLFVEETGAWARDPIDSRGLAPVRDELEARLEAETERLQLIRRPRGQVGPERTCFLAQSGMLQELDWSTRSPRGEVQNPMFFVCTHGKRDQCCALKGNAIYDAFARLVPNQAWQTSHLGGHRFAPTFVTMPSGYCYGHVDPDSVPDLVESLSAGQLCNPEQIRGNVFHSNRVQAAELFLRKQLQRWGLADLELIDANDVIHWKIDGVVHKVAVRLVETTQMRPKSCGDTAKPVEYWEASAAT